jgi:hypothetical protein
VRSLRGAARPALLASATLLLTACGIPTTDVVQAGPPASGIRHPAPPAPPVPLLYFVKNGVQIPVPRTIDGPVGVDTAVKAEFLGPNAQEQQEGLTTALPPLTAGPTVRTEGSQVWIGLPADTPRLNGTALQQLVCTVSSARSAPVPGTVVVAVTGPGHWQQTEKESPQDCLG